MVYQVVDIGSFQNELGHAIDILDKMFPSLTALLDESAVPIVLGSIDRVYSIEHGESLFSTDIFWISTLSFPEWTLGYLYMFLFIGPDKAIFRRKELRAIRGCPHSQ